MGLALDSDAAGVSPYTLALRAFLAGGKGKPLTRFKVGGLSVDVHIDRDSVWVIVRRGGGGGLALRAVFRSGRSSALSRHLKQAKPRA